MTKFNDNHGGFTLIEILASMVVLILMVMFLASIFDQVTKAWKKGERHVSIFDAGRGVMDEIRRDCQTAITDEILPFAVQNSSGAGFLGDQDRLCFTSMTVPRSSADTKLDIEELSYFVIRNNGRYTLYRRFEDVYARWWYTSGGPRDTATEVFDRPFFTSPDGNSDELIDNVYSFEVLPNFNPQSQSYSSQFYSKMNGNSFPTNGLTFVIRVLTDEQWEMTNVISDAADWYNYVITNGTLFSITVGFPIQGR